MYTHSFSSAKRKCFWHLVNGLIDWSSNDVFWENVLKETDAWRGRVVHARSEKISEQYSASGIASLEVIILSSDDISDNDDGTKQY